MMSRRERRQLRMIERNEFATDPTWATLMSGGLGGRKHGPRQLVVLAFSVLAAGLLVLALVSGITGLLAGAAVLITMAACLHLGGRDAGPRVVR